MLKTRVKAKVLKKLRNKWNARAVFANVRIRDTVYLEDGSIALANRLES